MPRDCVDCGLAVEAWRKGWRCIPCTKAWEEANRARNASIGIGSSTQGNVGHRPKGHKTRQQHKRVPH